jgi:hypothetical protein
MADYLPHDVQTRGKPAFFEGKPVTLSLFSGLHVFVGPNGSGKTETLRSLRDQLRVDGKLPSHRLVYLSSGRNSALELFRSSSTSPNSLDTTPAAIGHQGWQASWWQVEGTPGMFLRLKERPDLRLKVEARLQTLYQRRLRLEWAQRGLQVGFVPTTGGGPYYANAEASGLIQLIPLLAAVYDDGIDVLLIDEPEISMHPQLQAFLLQEMEAFAGDPAIPGKKLIIIATHSPTMLPVRRVRDIARLVFFVDRKMPPIQASADRGELKSAKLSALVTRLSENHKLAFFARSILLVEGPSDEITVSGVALKLEQPLLGSNTQIVPVTGKGQFSETVKLFRLMGKHVFVLADLDALADNNQLVSVFQDQAQPKANERGMGSVMEIDRSIRDKFNSLLDPLFQALSPIATKHRYWTSSRAQDPDEDLKAKRRAALAALLSSTTDELRPLVDGEALTLRTRYNALLEILDSAGCIILRRGTIEDYYFDSYPGSVGKPEAAAVEMEKILILAETAVRRQYEDVVRAVQIAAPLKKIDENMLLREQLGSLLGGALLIVKPGMLDDELNSRAGGQFRLRSLGFSTSKSFGTR